MSTFHFIILVTLSTRLLFATAQQCCYNTDCDVTYTNTEDTCFMSEEYSNFNEGFCWNGKCGILQKGSCQSKKSYREDCSNASGNADNNNCVTHLCSKETNKCEARTSSQHCIIPTKNPTTAPTPKPTASPTADPTRNPTDDPTNTPTKHPAFIPTLNPSNNPSALPSIAIIVDLTNNPTKATSNGNKHAKTQRTISPFLFFVLICVFLVIMAVVIDSTIKRCKNRGTTNNTELSMPLLETPTSVHVDEEKEFEAQQIQNAMVILIAIGEYDDNPTEPDRDLAEGLGHLDGVNKDVSGLQKLFGPNYLNYTIYSQYGVNDKLKLHWTQDEIVSLLKEKASFLENNLNDFDALIVVISSRELQAHICTSDCKMIEKIAIHRLFSHAHPSLRDIPRIFMFDCCDGELQCNADGELAKDQGKKCPSLEVESKANKVSGKDPDHKLVEINAATSGFPSTKKRNKQSFMLNEFVERMIGNLKNEQHEYIYKIFEDIQQHWAQKQRMSITYNDRTKYVKLLPNQRGKQNNDMLEI